MPVQVSPSALLRDALHLDRSQILPINALRNAIGVVVPPCSAPSYLPGTFPDLRADQRALAEAREGVEARTGPLSLADYRLATVVYEADRLTDAVNTITQLLLSH